MKKMIGTRRPASCVALGGSEPNERIQSSSTALSPRYNSSPPPPIFRQSFVIVKFAIVS